MTAKTIPMTETDAPAALNLSSSLSQPAIIESSVFGGKLKIEKEMAYNQVLQIEAEMNALTRRREDLNRIISACDQAAVVLEGGAE